MIFRNSVYLPVYRVAWILVVAYLQSKSKMSQNPQKSSKLGQFSSTTHSPLTHTHQSPLHPLTHTHQSPLTHTHQSPLAHTTNTITPIPPLSFSFSLSFFLLLSLLLSTSLPLPDLGDRLLKLMREMFGPHSADWWEEDQQKIAVKVDQHTAILDPTSLVGLQTLRRVFDTPYLPPSLSLYHLLSPSISPSLSLSSLYYTSVFPSLPPSLSPECYLSWWFTQPSGDCGSKETAYCSLKITLRL